MIAEARAFRLAEVRRRQHTTQVEVATAMGVTQARVSRIEKGQLERSEVDTLAAYVRAFCGKRKIVADFGDEDGLNRSVHHPGILLMPEPRGSQHDAGGALTD